MFIFIIADVHKDKTHNDLYYRIMTTEGPMSPLYREKGHGMFIGGNPWLVYKKGLRAFKNIGVGDDSLDDCHLRVAEMCSGTLFGDGSEIHDL